ncbi:MAG: DinB family protein [Armatimonadetes bacterium]|nr:DinB family protein [Armatimonadota bacterium]
MDDQAVQRLLLIGLDYSYLHDDWVNPLRDALDGLTAAGALFSSGPDSKCAWDIVLHIAVWNENMVNRIETGTPSRPQEGAWPAKPDTQDEQAWQVAQKRLWDSLDSLRATILTAPLAKIEASPYGTGDLLCRLLHIAYHVGQITKMREFID